MRRRMQPARKQKIRGLQPSRVDPGVKALTSMFRDLELNRPLGLLLHDGGSRGHMASVADILHLQSREIARSKLAIDCEIEHRKFPDVRRHLKSRSDRPNFSEPQRRLLSNEFALVPWHAMADGDILEFHDNPLSDKGRLSVHLRMVDGRYPTQSGPYCFQN